MNNNTKFFLLFAIVGVLVISGVYFLINRQNTVVVLNGDTMPDGIVPTSTSLQNNTSSTMNLIEVTAPVASQLISSPVLVEGKARGSWYFEASFPVKIVDANEKVLVQVPIQAQGDWMTTNFVPFSTVVTFTTPTAQTGFVIFEKDNPSGLPQNAAEYRVPVKFTNFVIQP